MPHIKALVTLNMTVGMPDDAPVNTWHFQGSNDAAGRDIIYDSLVDFYDTMRLELSGRVDQNGHRIKLYLMEDPEPRAPISDRTFSLTSAPAGGPQSAEVALCMSFQGDRVSGTAQATRRGRIFLGPLDTTVVDTDGRPASAFITKLANAGAAFRAAIADDVASTMVWCVYSPTLETLTPVTNGWVDNAFDTVRRRGIAPTARTTFA